MEEIELGDSSSKDKRSRKFVVRSRKTQAYWDEQGGHEEEIIRVKGVDGLVTRNLLKSTESFKRKRDSFEPGTLIWGSCTGWWPGLVVDPEDVGMTENPKKLWIFWLGESKISELRKKYHVKLFSDGSKERLADILNGKTRKLGNSFEEILKELALKMDCPLVKPYEAWVEKNFANLKHFDDSLFYPYPSEIQAKLTELKMKNSESLGERKSLSFKESGVSNFSARRRKKLKSPCDRETDVREKRKSSDSLHLKYQKIGTIVWAKIAGQIWWPGVITDYRDCGMKEPKFGCQWIMWYGDFTLSQVNHRCFINFEKGLKKFETIVRQSRRELLKKGILEAAKDYCELHGIKRNISTMENVFEWVKKSKSFSQSRRSTADLSRICGEATEKYPKKIQGELKKHISKCCTSAAVREHDIKNSQALRDVKRRKIELNEMCLMCLERSEKKLLNHPYFDGKLCEDCLVKFKPTIFAYDEDGKCFFCTICTGDDEIVICDNPDCPRVYCTSCLRYLLSPKSCERILKREPWNCYLCEESPEFLKNSIIKPRANWKDEISELFRANHESIDFYKTRYKDGKKKIRVLSLFDGISTGLLALEELGLDVGVYYASEVDPDAEIVSTVHFGNSITRLGDVRNITEAKLQEISPIDLLIGGSPCNDLSLVNPKRRGLHDPSGTGILFFEFCRVKKILESFNEGRHLFWMFENVASMPEVYKKDISENLECEPDLIDSSSHSPQHRPRFYWNNFPISNQTSFSKVLQDVLTPNCNRHALVKKIRTVTTQLKSLKQGSKALKPVLMNQEYDCLWTTELEEIFGFPRHYTDVKNLSATKRQKLIGRAWSVQTVAGIMRPLSNFFTLKIQPEKIMNP